MNIEAALEQMDPKEQLESSLPFPGAWWGRVLYGAYIIILPILSFWFVDGFQPNWQSGKFSDYIALLLFPGASLIFLILLAYSILCYLFLLLSPVRYARSFFIRLGIYTGVLLALQYSVLLNLLVFIPYFILLWIFPIVFWLIQRWATRKWNARTVNIFLAVFLVGAILAIVLAIGTPGEIPLSLLIMLMAPAPIWSFLLASRAAIWLFKNYEANPRLPDGLAIAGWVGAYVVAWRFDILQMYKLYTALPTEPPGCYIATAAARGHPQLVGAWTVRHVDGKSTQVNEQLQRLKCAELALMAVHPPLHRWIRRIYDVVGKRLAGWIQNPFLADAAYLLLKPWEWSARLVLKILIPEIDSFSKKMYMDR